MIRPGLRVLAVDDERPALEDLARALDRAPQVGEVVVAGSGRDALRTLADHRFDALFLDVRMPDLNGLELASVLGQFADPPAVVFVSAYEDGAVGAFERELEVLDYVVKPVSRERIDQALERILAVRSGHTVNPRRREVEDDGDAIIAVEHQRSGTTRLVARAAVMAVKAEGDYVRLITASDRFLMRGSLAEFERRWAEHGFVRVHRSYVVNLRLAVEIRPELGGGATVVLDGGIEVPVARRQVSELRRRLRG